MKHMIVCKKADTLIARVRGLIGKKPPFVPLFISPCSGIHTFFMSTSIDLIWFNSDQRVLRIDLDIQPNRMRYCSKASAVLEFSTGTIPPQIMVGDILIPTT